PARIVQDGRARLRAGLRRFAGGARRLVDALFEPGDQILEALGLLRQIDGAGALGGERGLAVGLLLLPLADQGGHAGALGLGRRGLALETVALRRDVLANAQQVVEVL